MKIRTLPFAIYKARGRGQEKLSKRQKIKKRPTWSERSFWLLIDDSSFRLDISVHRSAYLHLKDFVYLDTTVMVVPSTPPNTTVPSIITVRRVRTDPPPVPLVHIPMWRIMGKWNNVSNVERESGVRRPHRVVRPRRIVMLAIFVLEVRMQVLFIGNMYSCHYFDRSD